MNQNLASTIITDTVRISTAAIYYEEWFGNRFQFETIVFSKDEAVKFKIKIHGSHHNFECSLKDYSIKFHNKLVSKYKSKLL